VDSYAHLLEWSRDVRYRGTVPSPGDLATLFADFRRIEAEVLPRLRFAPFARLPFEG
jgi:hypothetical protein